MILPLKSEIKCPHCGSACVLDHMGVYNAHMGIAAEVVKVLICKNDKCIWWWPAVAGGEPAKPPKKDNE